jgi:hypothetical protein
MGVPTSAFLSEIYLQYMESNYVIHIVTKHNIFGYFQYVDAILIIYDSTNTDILSVLNEFKQFDHNHNLLWCVKPMIL